MSNSSGPTEPTQPTESNESNESTEFTKSSASQEYTSHTDIPKSSSSHNNKKNRDELDVKHRKRKFWLILVISIFLIIGILWGLYWFFIGQYYETTEDAYVNGNLVQVMSNVNGQVLSFNADVTDLVTQGQILIRLEGEDFYLSYTAAVDNLAVTVRNTYQLYKNVAEARANVNEAESNLEKAKEDYERRAQLTVPQVISAEEVRHYKLAYDAANDAYILAQRQYDAAVAAVQNTDLYHHPKVLQAADELRNAFLNLRRTVIYSPVTGYVAKRPVEVGEQITPNTILMVIVPLYEIWIDANYKETQLRNLRVGQPVKITADIYGSDVVYKGSVVGLSPGTGSSLDLLPPQNATGNWIKILQRVPVRLKINNTELLKQYPLRIGLSVTAETDTHDRSGPKLSRIPSSATKYATEDYSINEPRIDEIINTIIRQNAGNISVDDSNATNETGTGITKTKSKTTSSSENQNE